MKKQITGTLVDGVVRLDERVDIPNNSRVQVQLCEVEKVAQTPGEAWQQLKDRLKERPIHSGGETFTRDQLHERD